MRRLSESGGGGCGAVLTEHIGELSRGIAWDVLCAVEDELRDRRQELIEVLEEKKG